MIMTLDAIWKLVDLGAALATAEITDTRVDSTGYGEVELTAKDGRSFTFAVDPEGNVSLLVSSDGDIDEVELNYYIDWYGFNNGDLYNMIRTEWAEAANLVYSYDFYNREYVACTC